MSDHLAQLEQERRDLGLAVYGHVDLFMSACCYAWALLVILAAGYEDRWFADNEAITLIWAQSLYLCPLMAIVEGVWYGLVGWAIASLAKVKDFETLDGLVVGTRGEPFKGFDSIGLSWWAHQFTAFLLGWLYMIRYSGVLPLLGALCIIFTVITVTAVLAAQCVVRKRAADIINGNGLDYIAHNRARRTFKVALKKGKEER